VRRPVALLVLAAACGGGGDDRARLPGDETPVTAAGNETPTVTAATVERLDLELPIRATGTTDPIRAANLGPQITARVEAIHVDDGDAVEEGQQLVRLEVIDARLRASQAEATAAQAEAQAALAESEYARLAPLADRGTITPQRRAQLEAQRDALQSAARAARAAAAQARRSVTQAVVRAPFAGTVSSVQVEVGEVATVQPPKVLLRLVDLSQVEVRVRVAEADLGRIAVGDPVTARFPSVGREATGAVATISPEIDPQTRTAVVVTRIPNEDRSLRAGMFTEVEVRPAARASALVVPAGAVLASGDERVVFVIEGDRVRRRPVRVEPLEGGRTRILDGLSEGDRVAVDGLAGLADGARVRLAGEPQADRR
jgi:RND family efflux transporter MFP subunit